MEDNEHMLEKKVNFSGYRRWIQSKNSVSGWIQNKNYSGYNGYKKIIVYPLFVSIPKSVADRLTNRLDTVDTK